MKALPVEGVDTGSYFLDIDLNVEESTTKGWSPTKKKKTGSKRKMVHKIPIA